MTDADDLARAASAAVDSWCAENPALAWPVLPVGVRPEDFTEVWYGSLELDPATGELRVQQSGMPRFTAAAGPIKVAYERAAFRVWPYAYRYSAQLGTSYHWYWTCLRCGHTTKDLIPTRELAVSDAESHAAGDAVDDAPDLEVDDD